MGKRNKRTEIKFDAAKRHEFLSGFSKRKRERRLYGLAHQQLKDRNAKLEQKGAMRQRDDLVFGGVDTNNSSSNTPSNDAAKHIHTQTIIPDTQHQWGGDVVVRVSTVLPPTEEEDDDSKPAAGGQSLTVHKQQQRNTDVQQEYAGNVEKYLQQLKQGGGGKQNKKKHNNKTNKRKGLHGAQIRGKGGDWKTAQKLLQQKQNKKRR